MAYSIESGQFCSHNQCTTFSKRIQAINVYYRFFFLLKFCFFKSMLRNENKCDVLERSIKNMFVVAVTQSHGKMLLNR